MLEIVLSRFIVEFDDYIDKFSEIILMKRMISYKFMMTTEMCWLNTEEALSEYREMHTESRDDHWC